MVEAQRLGAATYGVDVDPLAVLITEHELSPLDVTEFNAAAQSLMQHLNGKFAEHYKSAGEYEVPLHYFYLRRVTCPQCTRQDLLYKSLVIVRDVGRKGAVVRESAMSAFCPECLALHQLAKDRKVVVCCGRRKPLTSATYSDGRFVCSCGARSTHEQLQTGGAPRILIAVEVTDKLGRCRTLRRPTIAECVQESSDRIALAAVESDLVLPRTGLPRQLKAHKPGIYGFNTMDELFSPRQLLVIGTAFRWLSVQSLSPRVKSALALALSNSLASNNLLCGYARDYGRLSPLFGVRDYSMPALSVELNPLHDRAGRGTIPAMMRRVAASKSTGETDIARDAWVHVGDASVANWPDTGGIDLVMTDPPYFDYIAYSDLSYFFRAWLSAAAVVDDGMEGTPLYENNASLDAFAARLAASFARVTHNLKADGLVVFTYHATTERGWRAVASALHEAKLAVTAAFPVWADAKSPGHGHCGNIEYDIVLCCRKTAQAQWLVILDETWLTLYPNTIISATDRQAWSIACRELNAFARKGDED